MRKKTKKADTPRSAHFSFWAASSFSQLASQFLVKMRNQGEEIEKVAINDLGGLISSATNLALSVELYLKTLRIIYSIPVLHTHDLWKLYKDLPPELRRSIELSYGSIEVPDDLPVVLELQISVGPFRADQMARAEQDGQLSTPRRDSLRQLLRRNKDAFLNWRYMYERGDESALVSFRYDFHYLMGLTQILHHHIERLINLAEQRSRGRGG